MSYQESFRRALKKYVRDASRLKSSLNVDLNAPPPAFETRPSEGTSVLPASSVVANAGIGASPINVDAIEDDDVQLLSSVRTLPQARRRPRRNQPVTVVLDEGPELCRGTSVINVDDHLSRTPLNSFSRRRRLSPNRVVINCEAYGNVDDDHNVKMKKASNPQIMLEEVPKGPMFSCPICMNALADACSTICGHVFCPACIKQAIQAQKKCPTCRRKLTASNFHRVYLPTA